MGMRWFLLPYFISLLLHFPSYSYTSSYFLCNNHDSSALLQFKTSFSVNTSDDNVWFRDCSSSSSSKTNSWKNGTDCCVWDGVTCDTMSGHVIALDLSCSYLQGQFHPNSTIFSLKHLQKLNLAHNDFSLSPIHSAMGDLVSLTHLNLSSSAITSHIPSAISHLSKLVSLDLSENQDIVLDSSTWNKLFLNATNLSELVLEGVDLSSIPDTSLSLLMNLSSSLVTLNLAIAKLQGNLPTDILCLPNLQKLDLSTNENLKVDLPKFNWSTPLRYLDLSFTALSGGIPDSIGHLMFLNHLNLWACNLDGLVPSSLFELTQLSYLRFEHNQLVGPIPSQITKLSKLSVLSLSSNMLNGTIPRWCFSLPSLLELDLSDNQFTGTIGEFSTYSLEYLDLSDNKIQGYFPNSIFELKNLTGLSLSSNNLTGLVDFHQFCKFKNLTQLSFSHNTFLSINIDNSAECVLPNLSFLLLSYSNITRFPKFLAQVKNLIVLDLSNNNIREQIPKWFHEKLLHSWKNIFQVDLSFNQLQGDLPIPPNGIEYFLISNNNFTGDISLTMCNASSLNMLNLAHNNLTGTIPQCLGTFPSLSVLDLQMNNLFGNIPQNFSKGNDFVTIKLNGNNLEGPLPWSLASCKFLEVLDLADNNIEDTFPTWLETLQQLKVLSLRSNKLHGVITCFNTKQPFPKLRIFDVSNNNFSGPLPASCIKNFQAMMNVSDGQTGLKYLGNDRSYNESVVVIIKGQYMELVRILTTFTTIDLSNNKFEGEIPEVIGKLHSLKGLNLSHNAMAGTIPQSLGNLRNLEWLDLSWNQLAGEIPMALANLTFLSFLNLSQNHFEGIIPTGRQFDTFGNDSYAGNPMLCGIPLSKSCNKDEKLPPHSIHHDEESGMFGWKAVLVGYACGMVFGMLLGYSVLLSGKPRCLSSLVEAVLGVRVKRTNRRAHRNHGGMN